MVRGKVRVTATLISRWRLRKSPHQHSESQVTKKLDAGVERRYLDGVVPDSCRAAMSLLCRSFFRRASFLGE